MRERTQEPGVVQEAVAEPCSRCGIVGRNVVVDLKEVFPRLKGNPLPAVQLSDAFFDRRESLDVFFFGQFRNRMV